MTQLTLFRHIFSSRKTE